MIKVTRATKHTFGGEGDKDIINSISKFIRIACHSSTVKWQYHRHFLVDIKNDT
jgi:hypothetical protein